MHRPGVGSGEATDGEQLAWLRRVTRNKLVDHYRQKTRYPATPLEEMHGTLDGDENLLPEYLALRHEVLAILYREIAALPNTLSEQMKNEVIWMSLPIEALSERYATSLQALSEIAGAYYFQGQLNDAFRLWQTGEQFLAAPEVRPVDKMKFLLRYGSFLVQYYFLTNREEELMLSVVQWAQQEAEALQDESGIATALFLVGQTLYYHRLLTGGNDYTEARDYFLRSSTLREKIGDTYELAESLFYTGLTYDRQEPLPQAKQYYLRALEIAEQRGNTWAAAEATRHLTDHSGGEQRLRYALRSLELRAEMNFSRALPPAQLLLSEIYIERGELEQALEYCQLAEELATEMDLQNYLVFASLMRGEIASKQGRLTESREHFEKAIELARQRNDAYAIAAANEKLKLLDGQGK